MEEEKCLHNILLHYFSDRSGLPSGRCVGKCSNCLRALGLPGAPPTRAELAAATAERKKKAPAGHHQGFVKASTLLGSGAQPSRKGAGGEGAGKGAAKRSRAVSADGGRGKGKASYQQAGSSALSGAQILKEGVGGGVQQDTRYDISDRGRGALLTARAKKMQAASLAAAGQHRIAQIQQKQAVQIRGATKALSEDDEEHLDDY